MVYAERHIYDAYQKKGGALSYTQFRSVLRQFNRAVGEQILEGYSFPMGKDLSRLMVVRVKRDFSNKMGIDWQASFRLRDEIRERGGAPREAGSEEGENWLVFYTDDWYCRFFWEKARCRVPNKTFYRFVPARGKTGIKTKLKDRLYSNEFAHLNYPFNETD